MKVLLLRFDAPLVSFGGVVVDAQNVTDDMPSRSMVTGLLGNALGYDHADVHLLARLQERIRMAVRRDREGSRLVDFQTVDLGQDFLSAGWTTWGRPEGRDGGSAASGTHIRQRHFLADSVTTVAITLEDADEAPTLDDLVAALDEPARPLFLGRKACLPSTPVGLGVVEAESKLDALRAAPFERRSARDKRRIDAERPCRVRVGCGEDVPAGTQLAERAVSEDRDWPNQIHVGRSLVLEGSMMCGAPPEELV